MRHPNLTGISGVDVAESTLRSLLVRSDPVKIKLTPRTYLNSPMVMFFRLMGSLGSEVLVEYLLQHLDQFLIIDNLAIDEHFRDHSLVILAIEFEDQLRGNCFPLYRACFQSEAR